MSSRVYLALVLVVNFVRYLLKPKGRARHIVVLFPNRIIDAGLYGLDQLSSATFIVKELVRDGIVRLIYVEFFDVKYPFDVPQNVDYEVLPMSPLWKF